jgi:hypothetical protein
MMGAVLFAAGSIGVQAAPVVVSIAGSGPVGWDNGLSAGNGTAALDSFLNGPTGVARASDGRLIVADYGNDLIRSINPSGIISTLGGDGWPGNQGNGTALGTSLWGPWGVAMRDHDRFHRRLQLLRARHSAGWQPGPPGRRDERLSRQHGRPLWRLVRFRW